MAPRKGATRREWALSSRERAYRAPGQKPRCGRLVRLALIRRVGVSVAAGIIGITSDGLAHWLHKLRKREGETHLPKGPNRSLVSLALEAQGADASEQKGT